METALSKLQDWSESWLLRLNIQKCKAASYGKNVNKDYKYRMVQEGTKITVQRDDHIKDLGVTFDEKLDFGLHVADRHTDRQTPHDGIGRPMHSIARQKSNIYEPLYR